MIKNTSFKIYTTGQMKYLYILRAEQVHGKLPFCFNNGLNFSRDWHSFKFTGKLFHKTQVFASGTRKGTPLRSE